MLYRATKAGERAPPDAAAVLVAVSMEDELEAVAEGLKFGDDGWWWDWWLWLYW